jgi:hypothetical protein
MLALALAPADASAQHRTTVRVRAGETVVLNVSLAR